VCTKIPPQNRVWPPRLGTPLEEAFAYDYIIDTTNQNLRNLGLERIDVQLLHAWIDEWAERDELQEAVLRLKSEGKIGAFGVSMNFPYGGGDNAIPGMRTGLLEVVEVVYNIHEQRPQYDVFPEALRQNVGVIARAPLNEGELSGRITPDVELPEGSFHAFYFRGDVRKREVYERAKTLDWLIQEGNASLPEAALRFCLSQPAVSTVIVGMEQPEYVRANVRASDQGPLDVETLDRLKAWNWPHVFWQ
jgi:aryl-alcohol dehydrogenase-like predicted oxidoreductase